MENWQKALNRFLEPWQRRDEVLGAMVTGSYAAGTVSKCSDIDVFIILSDGTKWQERGSRTIDGFLIEYFANSLKQLRKYLEEDHKNGTKTNARMYAIGRIVFDKSDDLKKLQASAERDLKRKLPKPDKAWIEAAKYALWDGTDGLRDLHHRKASTFAFACHLHLQQIIKTYSKFLQKETPSPAKLHRFLDDHDFRRRYKIEPLPDRQFVQKFETCLKKPSLKRIEKLTKYVLTKMGGFEVDGWKLRTPAESESEPKLDGAAKTKRKKRAAPEPVSEKSIENRKPEPIIS